jgi:hypothetical protein
MLQGKNAIGYSMHINSANSCHRRSTFLLEKLTVCQLVKKFLTFCGTWRFITVFTIACPLSLPKSDQPVHALPTKLLKFQLNSILTSMPRSSN